MSSEMCEDFVIVQRVLHSQPPKKTLPTQREKQHDGQIWARRSETWRMKQELKTKTSKNWKHTIRLVKMCRG